MSTVGSGCFAVDVFEAAAARVDGGVGLMLADDVDWLIACRSADAEMFVLDALQTRGRCAREKFVEVKNKSRKSLHVESKL